MFKVCSKCKTEKPLNEFHAAKNGKFGTRSDCKVCNRARVANYAANNRDKVLNGKAKYRKENPDKVLKWNASRNKEYGKIYAKQYAANNRAKRAEWQSIRRAKISNAIPLWFGEIDEFVLSEAHLLAKKREIFTGVKWEVDHMIPLQARNVCGLHVWNNFQVIPATLNQIKRNKLIFTEPLEWLFYGVK